MKICDKLIKKVRNDFYLFELIKIAYNNFQNVIRNFCTSAVLTQQMRADAHYELQKNI